MPTYIAFPVLTALAVVPTAAQRPCEGWTTPEFWRTVDPARVRECLADGYSIHDRFPSYNLTVLHRAAAFSDNPEVISVLVEAGADLEASSPPTDRTPLHLAARSTRTRVNARWPVWCGCTAVTGAGGTTGLCRPVSTTPGRGRRLPGQQREHSAGRVGEDRTTPPEEAGLIFPNAGDPNPAHPWKDAPSRRGRGESAEALDGGTPLGWAETQVAADLIRSETQRRAATRERFLRLVGTRVVVGAVVLALLVSLIRVGARSPRNIFWPATHRR